MIKFENLSRPLIDLKNKFEQKVSRVGLRYALYIAGGLLAALLALGVAAGIVALFIFLPPLWPAALWGGITLGTLVASLAMAPLGAIFFGLTFAFFHCLNQVPALRKAIHYLASGINNAANNGQAIESTSSLLINLGLSIVPGVSWLKHTLVGIQYGCGAIATAIGFAFGIKERKEKYAENSRYQQYKQQEEAKRLEQQTKVTQTKAKLLNKLQDPHKQEVIQAQLSKWQQRTLAANDDQGPAEPAAQSKASRWQDTLANHFNSLKNYLRNLKVGYKIAFGLIAIPVFVLAILNLLGLIAISPMVIPTIIGVAALSAPFIGIVFATMNHYRDKVEDQVFDDNKAINKDLFADKAKLHLLYEEELLHKQLARVNAGKVIMDTPAPKPTNFRRKYKNPLAKMQYGQKTMYGVGTFAAWVSLGFAVFSIVCTLVALKFTVLTAGLGLPVLLLSLGMSTLFTGLAVGNLARRYYKENKQQSACKEETAKYERLQKELHDYRKIAPAVKLTLNAKSERSKTAIRNYTSYKVVSSAKKVGKADFSLQDALHAWHLPVSSASSGIHFMGVTLHPLLIIPVILALPLMYLSYRCEKIRVRRDTQLDKLINKHMEIELEQRKAAKARMELVAEAQSQIDHHEHALVKNKRPTVGAIQVISGQQRPLGEPEGEPENESEMCGLHTVRKNSEVPDSPRMDAADPGYQKIYANQPHFWQPAKSAAEKNYVEQVAKPRFFKANLAVKQPCVDTESQAEYKVVRAY